MADNERADLIFTGGRVHTVDAANTVAEAVALKGDRILATGSDATISGYAGPETRRIELRGRSLLPGFHDAHAHFTGVGASMDAIDCKAAGMRSIRALQEEVRKRAASLAPGAWIRGRGYDQSRLAERRHPTRIDWDAVAPDNPVIFTRTCGHITSVNSQALALAGIRDDTPDPYGGRMDRDGGRLLGVLYETATGPVHAASALSTSDLRAALLQANRAYLAAGGTTVHDAGGLVGAAMQPCQDLVAAGEISVRLYGFTTVNSMQHPLLGLLPSGLHTGFGDDRLRLGAFKVITDGSSSGPTSATREPYASDPAFSGILYWTQEELDDLIGRAHRAGFQCTVHAVGDAAIEQTLNAMQKAQREAPRQGLRHRIEHCGICLPDLRERVLEQGIVPAMQPAFTWEFGDGYIANYGRYRADSMFPVRSLTAMGVRVAGSSDAPVTHYAPLFGMQQALTRKTMDGDVCGPDEAVDLTTAIRLHTINGAYASFAESKTGSIEPGKLADLVLLGADLATVPPDEVRDTPVIMTVVGGRAVYEV
jgi:predicted amidohydrolase YtcJ